MPNKLSAVHSTTVKSCQSQPGSCERCEHRHTNLICSVDPQIWAVFDHVKVKSHYKSHQTVFYQGNEPLGLLTVSDGLVKLESTSPMGQTHTIRYIGPGGAFGYQALFTGEKYNVSAVTLEPTTICFIPKTTVMDIFRQFPEAALRIMKALSHDLQLAEAKWTDQMDKDVPQRVAEALIFLQEHYEHQKWTRKEIAEWTGTTPESVIRTLSQFEKEGLIDQSEGRNIRLINKTGLLKKIDPAL